MHTQRHTPAQGRFAGSQDNLALSSMYGVVQCGAVWRSVSSTYIASHTAPHCATLRHTAPHCTTLHHTAPHCTTLQTLRTLQHVAAHYNTLHHTTLQRHTHHKRTWHHVHRQNGQIPNFLRSLLSYTLNQPPHPPLPLYHPIAPLHTPQLDGYPSNSEKLPHYKIAPIRIFGFHFWPSILAPKKNLASECMHRCMRVSLHLFIHVCIPNM